LSSDELLAWQLLSLVANDDRADLRRYLRRAVGEWSRLGKLTHPLVNAVCSHGEHEEHLKVRSWFFLFVFLFVVVLFFFLVFFSWSTLLNVLRLCVSRRGPNKAKHVSISCQNISLFIPPPKSCV